MGVIGTDSGTTVTGRTKKTTLLTTTVNVLHKDTPFVFKDVVIEGEVYRDGSNAREQILHGRNVEGAASVADAEFPHVVIPYHSILVAEVSKEESSSIAVPEDNFCQSTSDDDGK